MTKYIAYKGSALTIEWYYNANDKSQALEYFQCLDEAAQDSTIALFAFMADRGKIMNKTKFRNEGNSIYAFKPKAHRFLSFFVAGKKIIITNAFVKKQSKIPANEKIKALKYKFDYETRTKKGTYYD